MIERNDILRMLDNRERQMEIYMVVLTITET